MTELDPVVEEIIEDKDEIELDAIVEDQLEDVDSTEVTAGGSTPKIYYIVDTPQNKKTTSAILTEYEYSKCIGLRASQIERGGKIFTDYTGLTNPIDIAIKEFREKKTPLTLVRQCRDINNSRIVEKWDISTMSWFE